MNMNMNTDWDKLKEDHELVYFRADVCLGSPQSFSLEEKKQICADMEASTAEIDTAMKADFEALPPEFRGKLLDMLCACGPEGEQFWKELLLGEMSDLADELVRQPAKATQASLGPGGSLSVPLAFGGNGSMVEEVRRAGSRPRSRRATWYAYRRQR